MRNRELRVGGIHTFPGDEGESAALVVALNDASQTAVVCPYSTRGVVGNALTLVAQSNLREEVGFYRGEDLEEFVAAAQANTSWLLTVNGYNLELVKKLLGDSWPLFKGKKNAVRTANALCRFYQSHQVSVWQLVAEPALQNYRVGKVSSIKNFGDECYELMQSALADIGLTIGMPLPPGPYPWNTIHKT